MVTSDLGACEWFVWDLRRSGLIDRGQLDGIVGEFLKRNPRAEPPALADHLVQQGTLTPFQADRVLNGKTQGLVLGPYVLLDSIGSGSMGQVYKAGSKNDQSLYAVKVLPRRSMWNVRLARRQVRSFANFSHPAVVPFVDVGTAGGLHYLAWPLAEGESLEAQVQRAGKIPHGVAAAHAVQIAQGLTEAHRNSLFHGLVKPSNVLVGPDGQARILDFGIGSLLVENEGESLVDTMSTANTLTSGLDCSSPESIMEPTNRTPAGDQYSLGCVLYYCLTGRVPFPEGSAVEKMMAHQTKDPTPIRELSPEVPDGLCKVVAKLMAKTPDDRYTGCDEVVEALEPYIGEIKAAPAPAPAPAGGSGRVAAAAARRMPATRIPSGPTASGGFSPRPEPTVPVSGGPPARTPPPPKSNAGVKINPLPPGRGETGRQPGPGGSHNGTTRQPGPGGSHNGTARADAGRKSASALPTRGGGVPSRMQFQLPPALPPDLQPTDIPGFDQPGDLPQVRADGRGWADGPAAPGGVGPLGLVALALTVMVAVYMAATYLMNR